MMSELIRAFEKAAFSRTVEVREPKPGVRHQGYTKLVFHRFPVKGGLSSLEAMVWGMYQPSLAMKELLAEATHK
jgi:hypothetical protein